MVNLIALVNRLETTWVILPLSTSNITSWGWYNSWTFLLSTRSLPNIISSIAFMIISFRLNRSFFSSSDLLSIFVASNISSVRRFNLFAFLEIVSRNSVYCSILPVLVRRICDKPSIGWIGVLNSWAAILINSFWALAWSFNCSCAFLMPSYNSVCFHKLSNIAT